MTATTPAPPALPFTAAELVAVLRSQRGITEHPAGSNRTPYGAALGLDGVPWCALFVGWGVDKLAGAGTWRTWWHRLGTDLYAYTPALAATGRAAGLAVAPSKARAGDLVLFDFPDAVHRVQHVGVVVSVDVAARELVSIEGNTSAGDHGSQSNGGGVYERRRPFGHVAVVIRPPYRAPAPTGGAVRPPAASKPRPRPQTPATPVKAPQRPATAVLRRVLRQGMHGGDVAAVQRRLGIPADGDYGPKTRAAVLAFQRRYFRARSQHDGEVGPSTCRALGLRWL